MDMNTKRTDELEITNDCKENTVVSHFDREDMDKSPSVCSLQNSGEVINECDSQGDKCRESVDRCDSIQHSHTAFAYVPFNSPQEGFSNILHAGEQCKRNIVLDEVSKTLASLYCEDRYIDEEVPHSNCLKNNNELTEVDKHEKKSTGERSQTTESNTDVEIGVFNIDAHSFNEKNQCVEKLTQCEISEQESCVTGPLSSECLQHDTSVSDQIKFACQLELMPACLQKYADEISISVCNNTDQTSPSQKSDLDQKNCSQFDENSANGPIPMDGIKSDPSQTDCSCHSESIENLCSNHYMGDESGRNCSIQSDSPPDNTLASDYPAIDCCSLPNMEMYELMETSNMKEIPSLSNDNDCVFIQRFDSELIADVKITMENLVEKCCNVFVEHDENANTSFNQYAGKESASRENRLDMRAENESGLYSECTSLAQCLKAGSGHTNSSTINEANTSDLMKIGEPIADCQVPMAMPCHDNKHQEIGKSHENVAALVLHSSQNDICGVGQCSQPLHKLMDSSMQFTQVSMNLMQNESILIGTPPFSQKHGSSNEMLRCGEDLHAEDLKLIEALILRNFPLKKDDLISGNSGNDAFSDQVEMQVPEISLQEALLSRTDMPVSDFHSDITVIEELNRRKAVSGTRETTLDLRREEIYTGENKPSPLYSRSEDFEKRSEIADKHVGETEPWDQCTKFEDFHKEDVHSAEDVECESEILPAETNDDISHPSSSFKALSRDTCEGGLTIHSKMNENVMDLYGTSSQELLVGDVSESKNSVNRGAIGSTSITSEIDLTATIANNPLPESMVLSENNKNAADMQNTCLQSGQMRKTVSCIKFPVSDENNCNDQLEDQLISTQQFSASLSQVNIADYLSDNRDNHCLHTTTLSTSEDDCSVLDTENDHIVPNVEHTSECDSDFTMYDDSSSCQMKGNKHTKVESFEQQPSCFRWKYAPSLNFDDVPVNPDSKNYDEVLVSVLPLKTCTKPIRVGLSKKYRAKSLHTKSTK